LRETDYYPFGLIQQGISSKAAGSLENKKKYNGIEHTTDFDLNVYDAFYRTLDPQTGRWWQIDPKIENMEAWSPYVSNYDNPIRYSDPMGDVPGGGGDDPPDKRPYPYRVPTVNTTNINPFSPTLWYGVAAIKNDNVRVQYNKDAAKLSPTDKQGRANLKENARTNTPEPFKSIVEKGRPMAGEQAKVNDPGFKGNTTKTNVEVNETVKNTGTLGRVFVAGAAINSAVNIANSPEPLKQTVIEGGSWTGAIAAGTTGAEIGSIGGPVGAFVVGAVFSIGGGVAGSKFGKWLTENVTVGDGGKDGSVINGAFIRDVDLNKR
jgi:RHS repeat-associated protein